MKRISISARSKLRLLLYGKPGRGKTTLAGTAGRDERTAPVLWVDCGGNPVVLSRLREPQIDIVQLDALSDLAEVYRWLAANQPLNDPFPRLNNLQPPYQTLIFDGITHMQRLSFDAIMSTGDLAPGLVPPKPEWTHYRSVLGQMIGIASKFYTLNLHIIVTALEHQETRYLIPGDTRTAYVYREPLLAGQSVDEFPGWALNVGRCGLTSEYNPAIVNELKADSTFNIIQFKADRYTDAKDQHNLGPYMADPSIRKFLDLIDAQAGQ